jgi:hypothetical protein
MLNLDITDGPQLPDYFLTIPYQGQLITGLTTWYEKFSVPIRNVGENNELRIEMSMENQVVLGALYYLLGGNTPEIRTTVQLAKISE